MMANELNLDFEWDVHKASSNAAKHGVTFEQAATVWQDAFALTVFDAVHSNFEDRWHTLGTTSAGNVLVVSHTFLSTSATHARVRLISARPATRNERNNYQNEPR